MKDHKKQKFREVIKPGFSGPSLYNPDVAMRPRKASKLDPQAPARGNREPENPFLPEKSNLTVRRARYAMARLSGLDKTSAASLADGEPDIAPRALQSRADQLERVTEEDIRTLREQMGMIARELLADGLDVKAISGVSIATMTEIAITKRAPYRERLSAAKELAVIAGLYARREEPEEKPQESEALRAEITAKLRGLFGDTKFAPAPTITPEPEPPPGAMPWD
jgi:uncharacterized protein (UPF0335 family)